MKLFTIGPVEMYPKTLEIRAKQVPYFRNQSFSRVVLESSEMLKSLLDAPAESECIMLTCSGTGGMEATVMNCLGINDRALVIDGGSFGNRFCEILQTHGIPYDRVKVPEGEALSSDLLDAADGSRHTALLVNYDETSTGQLYDIEMLADYCRRNNLIFIVDAISAFLSDPLSMRAADIDAVIVSSQKALALAPGLSCVVLSPRMKDRILSSDECPSFYFDFKSYISNGKRGQTPFTPAVGVIYELHQRLGSLISNGGAAAEIARVKAIANDFRQRVIELPVELPSYPISNALTPLILLGGGARILLDKLERDGFVLNPCGGKRSDDMVRVAHVGNHSVSNNIELVEAMTRALLN